MRDVMLPVRLRLIASCLPAERNREAVPAVNPDNRKREVGKRLLKEITFDPSYSQLI
jgi:hypothetical protein